MLHHPLNNDGEHWAVGSSTYFLPGQSAWVLAQLQQNGEQVRVAMTAEQAEEMAAALLAHATKVREAEPVHLELNEQELRELDDDARMRYQAALRAQSGMCESSSHRTDPQRSLFPHENTQDS